MLLWRVRAIHSSVAPEIHSSTLLSFYFLYSNLFPFNNQSFFLSPFYCEVKYQGAENWIFTFVSIIIGHFKWAMRDVPETEYCAFSAAARFNRQF